MLLPPCFASFWQSYVTSLPFLHSTHMETQLIAAQACKLRPYHIVTCCVSSMCITDKGTFSVTLHLDELDQQGDQQCVDSDGFGEGQAEDQVCLNNWCCLGIAPDGVECLTSGDTNTQTWTDSSQTNCKCNSEFFHDDNPP